MTCFAVIALLQIPEIFAFGSEVAGWDTPGHYAAWLEWRAQDAPLLPPAVYQWKWLAGSSLFKFYPPAPIFILELVHSVLETSTEDTFRLVLILGFLLPAFLLLPLTMEVLRYHALKVDRFGIILLLPSFAWLLYPRYLSWSGFGLASLTGGMLAGAFGISLFLLATLFLLRFHHARGRLDLLCGLAAAALLPLTHYVATFAFLAYIPLWSFVVFRSGLDRRVAGIGCILLAPGLLFLSPLLTDGWIVTSGPTYGILSLPLLLLPLHVPSLLEGLPIGVSLLSFSIGVLLFHGVFFAYREKKGLFPIWSLGCLFIFSLEYLQLFLGSRFFHFYRLFPYFFILLLPYSAVSAASIWARAQKPWKAILTGILVWGFIDGYLAARWSETVYMPDVPSNFVTSAYSANQERYRDRKLAQLFTEALTKHQYARPERVFIETEPDIFLRGISGFHGPVFELSKRGVHTLNGLYVEGAPHTRVFQSVVCAFSMSTCWGPQIFRENPEWKGESSSDEWISILETYGVRFILSRSHELASNLGRSPSVELLERIQFHDSTWTLWKLPDPHPLSYTPTHSPLLFIAPGDTERFLRFSELHFLQASLRDLPVFFHPGLSLEEGAKLLCDSSSPFTAVIVPTGALDRPEPLIPCKKEVLEVPDFPVPLGRQFDQEVPFFEEEEMDRIRLWMEQFAAAGPQNERIEWEATLRNSEIVLYTPSPSSVILNGGYDPDWRQGENRIFITSPFLQMGLVSSGGLEKILYEPRSMEMLFFALIPLALGLFLVVFPLRSSRN